MAQLNAVSSAANAGWNLTAEGINGSNVGPAEAVDLNNSDDNIVISKTADSNDVTFNLADNLNVDSVNAGGTKIDANGLTFVDGNGAPVANSPSISATGIDAGNNTISNVAPGNVAAGSTDAVNGGQLYNAANNTAQYLGGGSSVTAAGNLTAPTYTLTSAILPTAPPPPTTPWAMR